MQAFETLVVILVLFALGLLLRYALAPGLPLRIYAPVAALLALGGGALDYWLSPHEYARELRLNRVSSLQFVEFDAQSAFPGQRGVMVVPTWLPLPSITGSLAAVAPAGAQFRTRWEGGVLWVEVADAAGRSINLVCKNARANGVTIVAGLGAVNPCRSGGDFSRH